MSKKILIIPAVLLVSLLLTGGGVLAYDGARTTQIAEGIKIGGVDVGGMEPARAQARIEQKLIDALERPVVVHHDKSTWTLGAREARIQTNAAQVVADAVRRSEEGGVLGRTFRRVTGGTVEADLQPAVTFSDRAVGRLIDNVREGVERPAKNAEISISAAGVDTTPGRRGLEVKAGALHKAINAAIVSPSAERRFVAETRKVNPRVTTEEIEKANGTVLIADRSSLTLRLYKQFKLVKTYGIAAGQPKYPTPAGQFTIANKAVDPVWSVPTSGWAGSLAGQTIPGGAPNNPLKARWMGITDGVGIHGTDADGSIGTNASHGCLRMRIGDVVELYPQVSVGAKILIV